MPNAVDGPENEAPGLGRVLRSERFIVAVAVVFLFLIAFGGMVAMAFHDASKPTGPELSEQERAEINEADCTKLDELYEFWAPGADSEPNTTATRLVTKRMRALGCPVPTAG